MRRVFLKKFFIFTLGFLLSALYMPRLSADENTTEMGVEVIDMIVGDIESIPVKGLTRVSLTNPSVADISDTKGDKVTVIAKKSGEAILFLWDADGKRTVKMRVFNEDMTVVKARVQKVLDEANITGISLEVNLDIGKVVVTGGIPKEDKSRLIEVLAPYNDNLLNLVKEHKNEELVQVDMQVVEISTSLEKSLGILWNSGNIQLNYPEKLPISNGKPADFFQIGNFSRTTALVATVNALLQEGKARLISKPRLVVVSGKQASFLVGGEIPVQSTTTNATGTSQTSNTTYSQYGVNMTVTPTIREGKIEVLLNVDIRDIDASNSSGGNVAFITRTASTNLFMDNKQTIVLAGLIKYTDSDQLTEVPFLSKIPIVGLLFRNRSTPSAYGNTEMVIILTPTVLTDKKIEERQIVMPTAAERASWKEFDSKYEHEPLPAWSPNNRPTSAGDTSAVLPVMTAYARMVQEKISRVISYPQTEIGTVLGGTVKLKLHILKDGSLDSEEVMESSGNETLDRDAMQAAKTAAPFDAFITGMDQEDMVFTIPIVYNKLISGGREPAGKVIASY